MAPLFRITDARKEQELAASTVELTLAPAETKDAFHHMDLNMRWTPDNEVEVKRRILAGLDLGQDVRGRRRQLFPDYTKDYRFAVNYNLNTIKVTNPKISRISNNILDCDNCYAFFKATFVIRFQFCFAYDVGATDGWIASDMLTNTNGVNALLNGGYGNGEYYQADMKDCRNLGLFPLHTLTMVCALPISISRICFLCLAAISNAVSNGWYYASKNNGYSFDASVLFEAYLEGMSGFGFGLST
jgi:hypothetical protein